MNYNYILSTGDKTISGSISNSLDRNLLCFFDGSQLNFDIEKINDRHTICASYNSQTLLEETPSITIGTNNNYYSINTGNFYIKTEDFEDQSIVYLDDTLTVASTDIIQYDKRILTTGVSVYKQTTGVGFWYSNITGLTQIAINKGYAVSNPAQFQSKCDIFFNGQKIFDTGQVPQLDRITGLIFAMPKKLNIIEVDSALQDTYGINFIENQVDFYINGMEQLSSNFLQLYTGVYTIKTGIQAQAILDNLETTTYSL